MCKFFPFNRKAATRSSFVEAGRLTVGQKIIWLGEERTVTYIENHGVMSVYIELGEFTDMIICWEDRIELAEA